MVSIRDLFEGVLSDLLCFLSAARVGDGRTPKELGKLLRCGMIGLDDPQILESKWKEIQGLQVEFHLVRHPRATGKMYLYIYNNKFSTNTLGLGVPLSTNQATHGVLKA